MCDSYGQDCDGCPMSIMNNGYDRLCTGVIEQHPDRAIEIVQEWSDEHPVKTRLDDLKERFPNVSLDGEGIPCFSPSMLGYCKDCVRCNNRGLPKKCWNEPVDGGATGKAVE